MITITPQPGNVPPRVMIELDSGGGDYVELTIRRDGEPIRQKPDLGSAQVVVYDYEAPYGRNITYSAVGKLDDDSTVSESGSSLLHSDIGWMIHPRQPSLSFPLPHLGVGNGGVEYLGDVENIAQATAFDPIGSDRSIVVISGSRKADTRVISVVTVSRSEKQSMDTILRDEVPLVFRFPTAWDMNFVEGFYKVGNVRKTPIIDQRGEWLLRWELPLQLVRPIVAKLQAQHTWQDVLDDNLVWQDVLTSHESWYDVLVDKQVL